LLLVLGIYLLPLGSKPEFVEHNGQLISVSQPSPILQSVYPEGIYATCGQGGTGTNCHTGCCSAGACVVCPPDEEDQPPSISASPTTTEFGGENNSNENSGETVTTNEGGNGIVWPEGTMGEVEFSMDSTTTTNGFPLDPNILWGVAATALAGATLAEWERQREEERKRRESEEAKQQKRENTEKRRGQKAQEDAVRERWAAEAEAERPKSTIKAGDDVTQAEKLAAYKQTAQYQNYWNGLVQWDNEKKEKERENESQKALEDFRAGERASSVVAVSSEEKPWWQTVGDFISEQADDAVAIVQGIQGGAKVKDLIFTELESGYISVSANTPPGTRLEYKAQIAAQGEFIIEGTRYSSGNLAGLTAQGLLKGAVSKTSIITAGLVSVGTNLYDFGKDATSLEDFSDKTLENQEFLVSTGVDFGLSVGTGLAAAAVVGGTIVAAVALGATAIATAPLALVIGATVAIAIGIGMILEHYDVPNTIKEKINRSIDATQNNP
jgi:hypothetical protein